MANYEHNGTELNNVKETWDRNERERASSSGDARDPQPDTTPTTKLDEIIQQEAKEYDEGNKEDQLLGGDRASVNDVATGE